MSSCVEAIVILRNQMSTFYEVASHISQVTKNRGNNREKFLKLLVLICSNRSTQQIYRYCVAIEEQAE